MVPMVSGDSRAREDGAFLGREGSFREVRAYQPVLDLAGSAEPSEDADSVKRFENFRLFCGLASVVTALSVLGYVAFASWQMVEVDTPEVKDHDMLQPAHQARLHRHHHLKSFPPPAPHPTQDPGDEFDCEALPRALQQAEIPSYSMGRMETVVKVENCSNSSEDCSDSGCCVADGYTCYRKHQTYAGCRKTGTCVAGHSYALDLPEFRTPWSCEDLIHLSQAQVRRDQEELAAERKALVVSLPGNFTSNEREWCCHHKNIGCPTVSAVLQSKVPNVYKDLLTVYGYGSCADGDGNNYDSWWASDTSRGSCQSFCDDYEGCVGYDFDVDAGSNLHNVCELRFDNGSMPRNTNEAFAGRWEEGFGTGDVKGVQADGSTRVCYKKMPQAEEVDTETTAEPSGGGDGPAGAEVNETGALAQGDHDAGIPNGSSLFCFTLFTAYEEELLVAALRNSAGIFACEGSELYSNKSRTIRDPDSDQIVEAKIVNVDLSCKYGDVWLPDGTNFQTAFNTPVFIAVWSQVVADGDFRSFGWTVKADADTVFFPDRLRWLISDNHYSTRGANGRGVFFNNCKLGLHGPIEVLSGVALEEWDANHSRCEEPPEEDVYLQQCMVKLEVEQVDRTDLLAEKGCYRGDWYQNPDWYNCNTGEISFHPFKWKHEWLGCFERASSGAAPKRLLLRRPKSHATTGQSLFDRVAGTAGLVAKAEEADGSTLMLG